MILELKNTTTRAINRELVKMRSEGGAVALGRVLTLIIDAGRNDPESAIAAANAASREHPCRILVVARQAEPVSDGGLDAEIRLGGDAGASEVVILRPHALHTAHDDTLVLPLLLPDAPIVVWWPFDVPQDPEKHPIGALAKRRITNAAAAPDPLQALQDLAQVHTSGNTDLAWTRTTLWRALVAATLDLKPTAPFTHAVVTGQQGLPSLDLVAAWLGHYLDIPARVESVPDAPALVSIELFRTDGSIKISRPDGRNALIAQPGHPDHDIILPIRSLDESLAEELRRLDDDLIYGEVLTEGLAKVQHD